MNKVNTPATIPAAPAPLYVELAMVQKSTSNDVQRTMLADYIDMFKTKSHDDIKEALASPGKAAKSAPPVTIDMLDGTTLIVFATMPNIVRTWVSIGYAESTAAKMHSQLRALVKAYFSGIAGAADKITNAPGYQKAIDVSVQINKAATEKAKHGKFVSGLADALADQLARIPADQLATMTDEEKADLQDKAIAKHDESLADKARQVLLTKAVDACDVIQAKVFPVSMFAAPDVLVEWLSQNGADLKALESAITTRRAKGKAKDIREMQPA